MSQQDLEDAKRIFNDPTHYGGVDGELFMWATEVLGRIDSDSDPQGEAGQDP